MEPDDFERPEDAGPAVAPDESPADPGAPFGRNPNTGKPYTMSAEDRAERGRILAEARRNAARTGRAKPRGRAKPGDKTPPRARATTAAPAGPNYTLAAAGLLQIPAFALGVLGKFWDESFNYDAAAVVLHTPAIAEAAAGMAAENDHVAAVLTRVSQVGPYGAFFTACLPLVLQIMANHKVIPTSPDLGIMEREELIKVVTDATDS